MSASFWARAARGCYENRRDLPHNVRIFRWRSRLFWQHAMCQLTEAKVGRSPPCPVSIAAGRRVHATLQDSTNLEAEEMCTIQTRHIGFGMPGYKLPPGPYCIDSVSRCQSTATRPLFLPRCSCCSSPCSWPASSPTSSSSAPSKDSLVINSKLNEVTI